MKMRLMLSACLFVLVTACGSGGGKEAAKDSGSVTITEKGENNVSIKEGDAISIYLELDNFTNANLKEKKINQTDVIHEDSSPRTGAFANGSIQYIKFVKIKGPDFESTQTVTPWHENKKYGFRFVAPDTKGAATVEYEYKTIVVNDKGASDESVRKITVIGVNNPPTIKLTPTVQVLPSQSVSLYATETTDIDGSVAAFSWVQISGSNVALAKTNQASLNFVAPNTVKSEELVFQLTATDNLGAMSTQKVTVTVLPSDLPSVSIRFPPATGYSTASFMSLSGYATARNNATITKLSVKIDNQTFITEMDGNYWSVSKVELPTALDTVPVLVTAEDSQGKISEARATIKRKGAIISDLKWIKLKGLNINPLNGELLALINDNPFVSDYELASINLDSNSVDKNLYGFPIFASESLPNFDGNVATAFSLTGNKYYLGTTVGASGSSRSLIHSIDISTKKMEQVYPLAINKDVPLKSISGIAIDGDEQLIVADGAQNKLFSVDPDKYSVKAESEELFPVDKVNYISLATDPFGTKFSPYILPSINEMPIYGLNISSKAVEKLSGDFPLSTSGAKRFVVDEILKVAYVLDSKGAIYRVNLATNTRTLFTEGPIGDLAYNPIDSILYFYYPDSKSIRMVDIFTAESIEITRSQSDIILK